MCAGCEGSGCSPCRASRQPTLGWAEFTGFHPGHKAWQMRFLATTASSRPSHASCVRRTTTLSADEGIDQAAADSRRRPEHADVSARCGRAKRRNSRSGRPPRSLACPRRICRRLLECSPLAVVRTAPRTLAVREAGAGCAGGRIRCLLGRSERASSRCRSGRRRRVWRRERAAAAARRPGRGRWR